MPIEAWRNEGPAAGQQRKRDTWRWSVPCAWDTGEHTRVTQAKVPGSRGPKEGHSPLVVRRPDKASLTWLAILHEVAHEQRQLARIVRRTRLIAAENLRTDAAQATHRTGTARQSGPGRRHRPRDILAPKIPSITFALRLLRCAAVARQLLRAHVDPARGRVCRAPSAVCLTRFLLVRVEVA